MNLNPDGSQQHKFRLRLLVNIPWTNISQKQIGTFHKGEEVDFFPDYNNPNDLYGIIRNDFGMMETILTGCSRTIKV